MAGPATVWLYRTGQRSVLTAEISAQEWRAGGWQEKRENVERLETGPRAG